MKKHTGYRFNLIATAILLIASLIVWQPNAVEAQTTSLPAQMNLQFSDLTIPAGGISVLSVTIYNPNYFTLTLSSLPSAWYVDLPAGLVFASTPDAQSTCGGVVSTTGTRLSLSGGTVPAQVGVTEGSCTVTVNVTSTTPGSYIPTIPANRLVSTDPTGTIPITNTTPASATIQVNSVQPPSVTKSFSSNTMWVGQTVTMSIRITNNDPNYSLTQVSLTDTLPTNVYVSSPALPSGWSTNCGSSDSVTGPGGSALAGGETSLTINDVTISPGITCTIKVNVTSVTPGSYLNTIPAHSVQSQQGVTNASAASAPLNVQPIGLTKSFSPTSFQAGGTSTLTITLQNPSTSDYTSAAFTDTLPAGVTLVSGSTSTTCADGSITEATGSISLSGATIPHGSTSTPGTCTVTGTVTSSIAGTYTNSIPAYALTAYNPDSEQTVTNVIAATANLTVYAVGDGMNTSTSYKSFSPSTIAIGGTSTLSIHFTAPADTQLTNFTMTDALPDGVFVANPPTASSSCGGTFTPAAGDTLLSFSGGTISKGGSCTLSVRVTSNIPNPPGSAYINTISPANISNDQNRSFTGTINASLTVTGLNVSKAFYPNIVNPGGISTLTVTLSNTNSSQLDNVSLTDSSTGPGTTSWGNSTNGFMIAPNPNATTTCAGGTVNAVAGAQSFTMTGGTIQAQAGGVAGLCTVSVDVIGKGVSTTYTDTIPVSTSTNTWVSGTIHGTSTAVTNQTAATATLRILPLTISVVKGFNPLSVTGNGSSTLTVELSNPNTVVLNNISFTDSLPQGTDGGMYIANPANLSTGTCGGTITASPGDTSFTYSGGALASGTNCSLTLSTTMNVNANLTNTIPVGAVTSGNGASNTQEASASLTNLPGVNVSKAFFANPIYAGDGNVSTLTITIQNTSNFQLDGLGMTDTFPDGLTVATSPDSSQCGGTVTSTSDSVTLTGGVLAGLTSCTVKVDLTAPASGTYTNCIAAGALSTTGNIATNQDEACDTLTVNQLPQPPSIAKEFMPGTIDEGGTSLLTFTITNPAENTAPLTGVGFTDTLPTGVTVASAPDADQCNGTVSSTSNSITLTGGSIDANSSCTVTVTVTSSVADSYLNTSGAVTSDNGGTGNTAQATLDVVVAPPSIAKAFDLDTITVGDTSTLTFTITNPNPTTTLTGVAFTDALPTGTWVADTPNASTTGCDASSTPVFAPGSSDTSLAFSNGSIVGGGTCTVSVDVTGNGGNYTNTSGAVTSTNGGTGNTAQATLDIQGLGLLLTKSTTARDFKAADDTIDYSYLLTNTGTDTLYAPYSVTDDKVTVTCPDEPASLNTGDTVTCTSSAPYTVTSDDVTAGHVTNTATATAMDAESDGNPVTSNTSSVTVELAALGLSKDNVTKGYRSAGDTIDYSYVLTNIGGVTLYPPYAVSDSANGNPVTVTCPSTPASLAPGDDVTCTATYTASDDDVTNGFVTNLATATAQDAASEGSTVTSNQAGVTVNLWIQPPSIAKEFMPGTIDEGGTSLLTFTITNPAENTAPLTGVGFTDTLPTGVTVASAPDADQCNGTVSSTSNSITLTGGSIDANSSCTVTVTVTSSVADSYLNTSGAVTSDNGGTGNTAQATLDVVVAPPSIAKAFDLDTITVGDTSTLTFTITNPNPTTTLTGVAFTDALPTGTWVANTPNASTSGCNASSTPVFAPGSSDTSLAFSNGSIVGGGTCTVSVDVTGNGGNYTNTSGAVTSTNGGTGNTAQATLDIQGFGLSLTKSTTARDFKATGDVISYSYLLTNIGAAPLYAPYSVSDNKTTVTCPDTPASLNPGDSVTCTSTYTVQSSDVTAKSTTNTATATAMDAESDGNPVTSNTSSVTVKLAALKLTKSTSTSGYRSAGNTISYSYILTNIGSVALYPPYAVNDTANGNLVTVSCPTSPSVLNPAANVTCTATYHVTSDDVSNGSVTNTATATAQDAASSGSTVTSNQASVTVYAVVAPQISKSFSPDTIGIGSTSLLTFTITNPSTNTISLTGVAFSDTLPSGVTIASPPDANQCGGTVSGTTGGGTISLSGGSIIPNGSCNVTVYVTSSTNGTKNNTSGSVSSTNGGTGNQASATLYVVSAPTITKSFSPDTILVGGTSTITFTLSASASNPVMVTGASFSDILPAGVQVSDLEDNPATVTDCGTSYTFSPFDGATSLMASDLDIAPGANCTITVPVTATTAGTFYNTTSTVTTGNGGTGAESNTATLTASDAADLAITKSDGRLAFVRSQDVSYDIVVTNNGPSDATGASVIDTLPSSLTNATWICTADAGASCTASGSGSIDDTAVDIPAGKKVTYTVSATVSDSTTTDIVNKAVVLPPEGLTDSDLDNNTSTDTDQLNLLTIAKSADQTTYATPGVEIDYSYTITNTGTSTLVAPFAVTDDKLTLICDDVPSTLAPEDSFTCTATYSTLQSDLDAGSIVNSVYATGIGPDGDTVTSNTATQTVNATPDLYVTKSDGGVTATPGSHIIYTLNYGVAYHDATGVVLTETLPANTAFDSADSTSGWSCSSGTCTYTVGDLAVADGEQQVLFAVTVNSYVPAGVTSIHNTVSIDDDHSLGTDVTPDDNTASTDTPLTAQPAFTITKSDGQTTVTPGQRLTYTINYSNSGNQGATGVVLTETIPAYTTYDTTHNTYDWSCAGSTCTLTVGALPAGSGNSGSATFVVDVDATVPSGVTQIFNTVSIDDDHSNGTGAGGTNLQTATDTDTLNAKPTFTISKTDNQTTVVPGQELTYAISYRNTGNQDATGVALTETVPTNTTFNSSASTTGWSCVGSTCTLAIGALSAGSSGSATFVVDIISIIPAGANNVVNTISIDDDHSNGTGAGGNNKVSATDTDTLNAKPSFTIAKDDGETDVVPGQRLTYTIDYSNVGDQGATGVKLTETVPTNTTFNSALSTPGWSCVSSTCTLTIGALPAGSSNTGSATFVVDVNTAVTAGATQIVNTVSIDDDHANGTGTGGTNKVTATDTDDLTAQPAFSISKSDGQTAVTPGQRLTYTINYSNVGNQGATGVVLTETIPDYTTFNSGLSTAGWSCTGSTCTLAVGSLSAAVGSNTGTATFVVDVDASVPSGVTQTTNTVTIDDDHSNGTGPGDTNLQTATDTDTIDAHPAFTITKSDGQTTATTGQRLTYTITYSNSGDQDATGVVLTETIPTYTTFNSGLSTSGWDCSSAPTCTFAVGAVAVGSANGGSVTFVVDVDSIVPSGVTQIFNTVSIDDDHSNGTGIGGNNQQTATDTDTLNAIPVFTITKDDGQTTVVPGQRLTYTINYSNTGDQDATGVVLTETLPANTTFNSGSSTPGWDCSAAPTCTLAIGSLAAGNGNTGSATFAVDISATVPAGATQVVNTVSIDDDHSNGTGPGGSNQQTATDTDDLNAQPAFTISKDDGVTTAATGQQLTYTIDYSNVGDQGATGVVLTETIPDNTTFNPGASTSGWDCSAAPICTFDVGSLSADSGSNTGSVTFVADVNATVPAGATQVFNTVSIDDDHTNGTGAGGNNKQTATDTDDLIAVPVFSITKDDGETTVTTGQTLVYTIDYSNIGDQGATGVVLTETIPDNTTFDAVSSTSGWDCTAAPTCTLAVGALAAGTSGNSGSAAFAVTVDSTVPSGVTQIFNTVMIDDDHSNGTGAGGNNQKTATDTDTLNAKPMFTISKSDGVADAIPGQRLTYTIDYSNTGDQGATGVVLTETIPTNTTFNAASSTSGWDCTAAPICTLAVGALAAGSNGSATFVVDVNNPVPSGVTQIFNTVTIDDDHSNGTGAGGNNQQTATDTDTLTAQPAFAISKDDGVTIARPGDTLIYTIDYGNTGNQDATGVFLTETVPENTTFDAGDSTTGWSCAGSTCTFTVGDLPGGGSGTSNSVAFAVTVINPVPSGETEIFNTVTIDDDHTNSDFHQTATDTDTLNAEPAFAISKDDGVTDAKTGDTLIYTIDYGNTGDQDATGVFLTEIVPDNTTFDATDSTTGWSCVGSTCTFTVGDLPGGGSLTSNSVAFAVTVNADIPAGASQIVNTVTIDDDRTNGDFHQTATDTDTLTAQPSFTISKDDGETTVVTGQTLVYTIDYSNVGDQGATGVTLSETIPANTTFDAADSTTGWSCGATTCTFTVGGLPAGTDNTGSVNFAVTVNATVPSGVTQIFNTVSIDDDHSNGVGPGGDNKQTATDTDDLTAKPAFTISKTDGVTQVAAGSQMTYSITVTNNGDQDATGVVVVDTLDANVDFVSATPSGQATYDSGLHTVTWDAVDLAAGDTLSPAPTVTVKVHNPLTGSPEPTQIINNVQVDDDHSNGVDSSTGDNQATASDTDGISFPTKALMDHDGPAIDLPQVAIGEGLLYETTVEITPGEVTNLKLVDVLDHGLAFWKCDSIYGTGSATGLTEDPDHLFADVCANTTPTIEPSDSTDLTNAGRRIEYDFGTVGNTSSDVITLHVRYWVIVLDMAGNVRGTTLNNNAQWTWDGGTISAQAGPVTVVEPSLTLTKVSDGTIPAKGRVITYTLTLDHAATSNEDAYEVVLSDVVPAHMAYVPGSLKFISGQTPTELIDSGAPTLQVKWDDFQLDPPTPTVRQTVIQFQATVVDINPGQSITNTANAEWRSMHNPAGPSVARSPWNTYSTERYYEPPAGVNDYYTSAQARIQAPELPNTGFAPGKVTLREQAAGSTSQSTGLSLEIPALKVNVPIVGIPYSTDGWDLTWLEKQAGYLEGTAYPTWTGNSVITGHVYNADGTPGIFVNLSTLKWGDQVIVHDGTGQEYIYEVRNVTRTTKDDLSPLQHENNAWVTLLTCEGYDATTGQYTWRVAVSAVLIKVQPEQ